jgi:outer membrane lipoprotein SlyB
VKSRLFSFLALLLMAVLGGCAVAQTRPKPPPPIRDVAREERGEILTVRDTRIDISTGMASGIVAHTPTVGVGPFGVRVPVLIGGEKKTEIPGEEITIQLVTGKLISVVQELSTPPLAPGERVRILHERVDDRSRPPRIQVVRD